MVGSTLMEDVVRKRTARRRQIAVTSVAHLTDQLRRDGVDVVVVGSLATGKFRAHSDVDLLVRSDVDRSLRARIERIVAQSMRGTGIPYDLIFAVDLTADRLKELERDLV